MRIDVKVSTKSDHWFTGFNGTLEEAKAYFLGVRFEGIDPHTNELYTRNPVIKVEEV